MINKQEWIDEIIKSAKDVRPVQSNSFMVTRIESKLRKPAVDVPMRNVYTIALAMAVLVIVNITTWRYSRPEKQDNNIQQLMQEYGWGSDNLYTLSK